MKTFGIGLLAFAFFIIGGKSFASLHYDADIKIDRATGTVSGKVTMKGDEETVLYIPGFYDLKLDGRPVLTRAAIVNMPLMDGETHVLEYKKGADESDIFSENFISVSRLAPLPLTDSTVNKTFKVVLPADFKAVGEAEKIYTKKATNDNKNGARLFVFEMSKPLNSFDIIASTNFAVKSAKVSGVDLYTYFFTENASFADAYLKSAAAYIKMYEELFKSPFPYSRFSIVEHTSPYGYATPTYTVLGSQVLRLPFITSTSLGHEIVHQWFGCAIDGKNDGNWFEGIAAYFADMHYLDGSEKEAYRKNIMINYDIYHKDNRTYPLKNFAFNDSRLSQTVGYGKGAMVFHMLHERLGKDKFDEGIQKFIKNNLYKHAGWADIFESFGGADLKNFSDFWLNSKEAMGINVSQAEYVIEQGKPFIAFNMERQNGEDKMQVPFTLIYKNGEEKGSLISVKGKESFKVPVKTGAVKLVIDKNYDIMRKLTDEETPAVINHLLEADKVVAIVSDNNSCGSFFGGLKNVTAVKKASELTFSEAASDNLVICGYDNEVAKSLIGSVKAPEAGITEYFAFKNLRSPDKFAMIVSNPTEENSRLVKHYGKYSKLRFDGRKNVLKEISPSQSGIFVLSRPEDLAVAPSAVRTLDEIVTEAKKYSAIFVGEKHDEYAHHINQLEIIKKLKNSGVKIAVGFEMIQKQFQNVLDDFINGKISEAEFLKKTEYFDRWSFDYNLYAPIFRYLRDNKIDGIALNIDGAVNKKISSGNFDNLTESDKSALPREMNLLNPVYKNEIKEIFSMHGISEKFDKRFGDFFLAQNVWDEVMAESATDYQKKNPDTVVVVIAGGGHLKKDSGIPLRYKRLTGRDGYVILQDENVNADKADAIIFTSLIDADESPKLGVSLVEDKGKLIVAQVSEKSPAEKAGIVAEDVIIKCGDTEITSVGDLKYALFFAGYGADLKCLIERKKATREVNVKLEKDSSGGKARMEEMMKMMNKKP